MQKKMRILFDYSIFIMQKYGGVSRYFTELYKCMKNNDSFSVEIFTDLRCNSYMASAFETDTINNTRLEKKIKLFLYGIRTVIKVLGAEISKNGFDIIHCTWYNAGYIKVLKAILGEHCPKIVVTIHDLIPFIYCDRHLKKISKKIDKVLSVSDGIICVSKNTKNDLIRLFPKFSKKNIPVIYHGISMQYADNEGYSGSRGHYALYVGKRAGYKNFKIFAEAIAQLNIKKINLKAICVGGGAFSDEETMELSRLGVELLFTQTDVSDYELVQLYRKAECFVYPSLYEGFGIPILESFACECPVILSDASCFPEIADDAAIYFAPNNHMELAIKIEQVISSSSLREKLVEAGKQRLRQFKWEKSAKETIDYYRLLLNA